jgi:hypothetical protein
MHGVCIHAVAMCCLISAPDFSMACSVHSAVASVYVSGACSSAVTGVSGLFPADVVLQDRCVCPVIITTIWVYHASQQWCCHYATCCGARAVCVAHHGAHYSTVASSFLRVSQLIALRSVSHAAAACAAHVAKATDGCSKPPVNFDSQTVLCTVQYALTAATRLCRVLSMAVWFRVAARPMPAPMPSRQQFMPPALLSPKTGCVKCCIPSACQACLGRRPL